MDNTNKEAYLSKLEKKLRFLNRLAFILYPVCLTGFAVLYALYRAGKIQNELIHFSPLLILFVVMASFAAQTKYSTRLFHLPLSNREKHIADQYYIGRMLSSNWSMFIHVMAIILIMFVIIFIIRVFLG